MQTRRALIAVAAAATLLLAACSEDEPETPATSAADEAPDVTEAPEPMDDEPTGEEPMDDEPAGDTIPALAAADGRFTTLLAAVEAAGLAETLSGEGPFTVFAPTDDAFAALPEGTVATLLEDPEGALTDILLAHVVEGAVPAADVVGLSEVTTINGTVLPVLVDGDTVTIGGATVIVTDLEASNGIVHVIDTVIVPEG
jgi:uncharacterized surface protein with fasciclin (FAS1) repeats